jgi:LPXTG-site transpeptidase (sortase) family protein
MPEEKEEPKPVVSEDEIERIIKELEKKEEERRRQFDLEKKEREKQKPVTVKPPKPELLTQPPPEISEIIKRHPYREFFKYLFLFLFIFAAIYFGFNYQSFLIQVKYIYKTDIKGIAPPSVFNLPETPETGEVNLVDSLIIPKIQVQVPIIWQVESNDILKELKNGVTHLKGTALPNEEGNLAIFGYSSNYPWQRGKYNQVFALLDKLDPKDKILIVYQKKKYFYEVTDKKIIKPEDVKILSNKESSLTLVTGWPLGINLKRLIVYAQQTEKPPESLPENLLPTVF